MTLRQTLQAAQPEAEAPVAAVVAVVEQVAEAPAAVRVVR